MQYKRAQDSAQMRKLGIAAGHTPVREKKVVVDEVPDLGDWNSNDNGSFSEYDSEEEVRRLKRQRRRIRSKK